MNNPFPVPEKNNTTNTEVLNKITTKVRNGNLHFHYFLDNLQKCSETKNLEEYLIWSYYATNVILKDNKNHPTDDDKAGVIIDLQQGLNTFTENQWFILDYFIVNNKMANIIRNEIYLMRQMNVPTNHMFNFYPHPSPNKAITKMASGFGVKREKDNKKMTKKLRRIAKKKGVKLTYVRNGKRHYKTNKVLKKAIK